MKYRQEEEDIEESNSYYIMDDSVPLAYKAYQNAKPKITKITAPVFDPPP